MATVPLGKLVNGDQWEAEEDLAGRLGIVAHAAFLRAGFVPYGDEPISGHLLKQVDAIGPSAPCLSRRYTAAQLARREGGVAVDAAVMELRAWGNGDVAFQAYLVTRDGDRLRLSCEAVLDEATLAPLLSCRLADAARALETGSAGAWIWKSLADWAFPALLLELCRRNDLPVTHFASLPEDAKAEVLKRLADGKDLARVECVSRQLRSMVAERDGELWKAMYESLSLLPELQSSDSDEGLGSWKERYMKDRRRRPRRSYWPRWLFAYHEDDEQWLARRRRQREASLQYIQDSIEFSFRSVRVDPFIVAPVEPLRFAYSPYPVHEDSPSPPPEREVAMRGKSAGRQRRKVQRKDYQNKHHGAGAIHSPSSRYKWKHR